NGVAGLQSGARPSLARHDVGGSGFDIPSPDGRRLDPSAGLDVHREVHVRVAPHVIDHDPFVGNLFVHVEHGERVVRTERTTQPGDHQQTGGKHDAASIHDTSLLSMKSYLYRPGIPKW